MVIKIITGPAIRGHIFRDEAEAIAKALPVLVGHYARATGLDVHHAEVTLVEVRRIARDGRRATTVTTEVRDGGCTIASWREVGADDGPITQTASIAEPWDPERQAEWDGEPREIDDDAEEGRGR